MTTIGVFADVHGNLEALDAVFADMAEAGVDATYCLGDVVGYGADPGACLERVRGTGALCVTGNHDAAVAGRIPVGGFHPAAREAVLWTRRRMDPASLAWLAGLPSTAAGEGADLTHASFEDPLGWPYRMTVEEAWREFAWFTRRIGFFGHTHRPSIFTDDGRLSAAPEGTIILEEGRRYLINPGSVGQPRDGDPRASWILYRPGGREIAFRRVPYPVETAAAKIRAAGLPESLAARLVPGI